MSQTPIRTLAARVAPVLLLAGLVAGCGDDGDKGSKDNETDKTSQSASPETEGSEDATESEDTDATGTELTKENFAQTLLEAQKEAGSYRTKQSTTTGPVTLEYEIEGTYDGDDPAVHSKTTPSSTQQVELILVDSVAYIKGTGLGDGTKWIKVDTADPANQTGPLAPLALAADPEAALEAFGDPTSVEKVGEETVEGVDTTRYKVTVATDKYVDALGLPAEAAASLPAEITQDVWVDGDNRQIKSRVEFDVQGQKSVTEQTFYDYGADVTVTAPDDADTITPQEAGLG